MTQTRKLATADVFPIGLGGMPMSLSVAPGGGAVDPHHPRRARRRRELHRHRGRLLQADDSDIGHNERLIAKAIADRRDGVIVATKGGHTRTADERLGEGRPPGAPARRLRGVAEARSAPTVIDLYQFHRPDPNVPYAESIGAIKELQDEGKVRWLGISNADTDQIEEALAIADIVSVQNQLSLEFTSPIEKGEVALCDGARDRVPAVVAARRHLQGGRRRGRARRGRRRRPRRTASRPSRWRSRGCSRSRRW